MSKFDDFMESVFGRLDTIEKQLKTKPPKIAPKKKDTEEFKLLREHYDNLFGEIRTEFKTLKEEISEPRKQIENGGVGKAILDFFLKP